MSVFFNSQFNYCPLVWMCHNLATNRKLNKLHQKCLHIICNYVSLKELLKKDGSVSIHDKNIQCLALEMSNVSSGLSSPFISDIFKHKSSRPEVLCNKGVLKNFTKFTRKLVYQSHFFSKVAGLWFATLLKRDSGTVVFL